MADPIPRAQATAFSTGSAKREVYIRDAGQKKAHWASQLQAAKAAAKQQQRAVDRLKGAPLRLPHGSWWHVVSGLVLCMVCQQLGRARRLQAPVSHLSSLLMLHAMSRH